MLTGKASNKMANPVGNLTKWEPHVIPKGQENIPVAQIDIKTKKIVKIYESAKQASIETGALRSKISNVCHGKRKSTCGYYWKFVKNL